MTRSHTPAAAPDRAAKRWRLGRVELLTIGAFWTLMAALEAANRLLGMRDPTPQWSWPPVAFAFFESYLWALLTPPLFWLASRSGAERSGWAARVLLLAAVGVGVAVFVDVAGDLFRVHALGVPRERAPGVSPVRSLTRLWFIDEVIVFVGVVAAGLAREYFVRYRLRREEATRLQAQAAQLQAQLAGARLEALRMQIDPHFLFNTLHAVSTLVERDPRGVRRMIARLSELLRYTLDGAREAEVPLQQEIQFLERYLEIMQVRFQGRLRIDLEVDPELRGALVPNLILQPLVENAVKHGVSASRGSGWVEVRARRAGDRLLLSVRDDGPGLPGGRSPEGVGLRNTRERLEQLYGARQRLSLRPGEEGGLVAEIEIPLRAPAEPRSAGASSTRLHSAP